MYKKNPNGTFTVTSKSHPEQKWVVSADMNSCNCPKFRFILRGQGECHHMKEVRDIERIKTASTPVDSKFETFNSATYLEPLLLVDFTEKYGDSQLDVLIAMNQVVLDRNRVRRLA